MSAIRYRDFPRTVKLRIGIKFITGVTSAMITPFLAVYFAGRVGEGLTAIMFMTVIVAGVAGGLIGGVWADRVGRKRLMVIADVMVLMTYLFIAIANSPWMDSPYLTFFLFIPNMFGIGLFGPASQAMIVDVSEPASRPHIYAALYWSNNLAMAAGGLAGGFLFADYRFVLFLAVAFATLLSLVVTILFIDETHQPPTILASDFQKRKSTQQTGFFAEYVIAVQDRRFMLYILATIILLTLEHQLTNYIGVRLSQEMKAQALVPWIPFSPEVDGIRMLGILKTENTLLVVLGGLFATAWLRRFQNSYLLFGGISLFTAGTMAMGITSTSWLLLLSMLVLTVGELMYAPIKQTMLADLAPAHARSTYFAMSHLAEYGAMIMAAACISLGSFVASAMMAFLYLVGGVICIWAMRKISPVPSKISAKTTA